MRMRLYLSGLALAVIASFALSFIVVSALVPDRPRAGVEISQADYGERWPFKMAHGWLRCEGAGAVILNVRGKDYAVNGLASARYAPIQASWTNENKTDIDVGPIISRGLTLCHW